MNLAVFDVDGTLLRNEACEDECYAAALRRVLGLRALDVDWAQYHDVSDSGIAVEAFRREFASAPSAFQLADTVHHFVALLRAACNADPEAIVPVLGATKVFAALAARGWAVAIATGAWRDAAALKLSVAGIDYSNIPMATAEDGPARTSILKAAQSRAEQCHQVRSFARVVSIGDAVWDVRAASDLGLPFVGIGRGTRAERLRSAGARVVLSDFNDHITVFDALETSGLPLAAAS